MTISEFTDKWLGKKADFDGYYGGQCVDLYRFYVQDVLGYPQSPGVGGAAEIWHTASDKYYNVFHNDPMAVPQRGDIIIWNRNAGGGYGHVAIFLEGDVNDFISLDQNWPTLSKVTKTKHNYKNIIGWLRPKKFITNEEESMNNQLEPLLDKYGVRDIQELDFKINEHVGTDWGGGRDSGYLGGEREKNKRLAEEIKNFEAELENKETTITNLNKVVSDKNSKIELLQGQISTCDEKLLNSNGRIESLLEQAKKLPKLQKKYEHLLDEKQRWQKTEKSYNRTIGQLKRHNRKLRENAFLALFEHIKDVVFTKLHIRREEK